MGWIKFNGDPHECALPELRPSGAQPKPGDVWQCGECARGWRRERDSRYWVRISARRLGRIIAREQKAAGIK